MKVKIVLIALMIIGLIGTGSMAIAGEKNTKNNVTTETGIKVAGVEATAVFKGMVKKTKLGIVLVGDKETYVLEGENLEELLGRGVEITGTLIKGDVINTIIVAKAEFAKL